MRTGVLSLAMPLIPGGSHAAQDKARIPELRIERVDGEISVDGELSEPIWQKAGRIDEWFEASPGDNVSPRVESIGRGPQTPFRGSLARTPRWPSRAPRWTCLLRR